MPSDSTLIQPFDLHRMFLGDLPVLFTLEVIVRTVIMYGYTLLLVRWLSRRAVGQLSLVEFLLVIALGSAVGDPMFYPDVPLLHAMAVVAVVVFLNRGLNHLIIQSGRIERLVEGTPVPVVEEGLIQYQNLNQSLIGHEELFEYLRLRGVEHLGVVRQAYIEQGGRLSLFRYSRQQQRPGLRINPPGELAPPLHLQQGTSVEKAGLLACVQCGYVQRFTSGQSLPVCPRCQSPLWTDAVQTPQNDEEQG
jgi:uncharacterized membrane protein YcaP (DUF421 family)